MIIEISKENYVFMFLMTTTFFFFALMSSIRVFCTFMARLVKGIVEESFEINWGSISWILTTLWTIFFVLYFFK